jgi:hypothetical protein
MLYTGLSRRLAGKSRRPPAYKGKESGKEFVRKMGKLGKKLGGIVELMMILNGIYFRKIIANGAVAEE